MGSLSGNQTKFSVSLIKEAILDAYGYQDWRDCLWAEKFSSELETAIGSIGIIKHDRVYGEEAGELYLIFALTRNGVTTHYRVTGYYDSYDGVNWYDDIPVEVEKVEKRVVVETSWEPVAAKA